MSSPLYGVPWECEPDSEDGSTGTILIHDGTLAQRVVCVVMPGDYPGERETVEFHARLIMRARELMTALINAHGICCDHGVGEQPGVCDACRFVKEIRGEAVPK